MLGSVREVFTKDIEFERIKDFLETEIEVKRLKELLSAEVDHDEIDSNTVKSVLQTYNACLIESLINEHKELLFIYNEIVKNTKAKKYSLVSVHLDTFQGLLSKHYQKADKQLYDYLEVLIRGRYPKRQRAYLLLSREAKETSMSIFYYLSKSTEINLNDDSYYCFMCAFSKLSVQLKKRIDCEKSLLFTMYEDSQSINWENQLKQSLDRLHKR